MNEQQRYFGFNGIDDMREQFAKYGYKPVPEPFPTDEEVLFASYGQEQAYSGEAKVLFVRDGVLYEVVGSHCSCMGLEDQWEPAPVTWAALRLRNGLEGEWSTRDSYREHTKEAHEAWNALVAAGVDK